MKNGIPLFSTNLLGMGGPRILNLFIPLVAKVGLAWVTDVAIVVVTKR